MATTSCAARRRLFRAHHGTSRRSSARSPPQDAWSASSGGCMAGRGRGDGRVRDAAVVHAEPGQQMRIVEAGLAVSLVRNRRRAGVTLFSAKVEVPLTAPAGWPRSSDHAVDYVRRIGMVVGAETGAAALIDCDVHDHRSWPIAPRWARRSAWGGGAGDCGVAPTTSRPRAAPRPGSRGGNSVTSCAELAIKPLIWGTERSSSTTRAPMPSATRAALLPTTPPPMIRTLPGASTGHAGQQHPGSPCASSS